MDSDFGTIMRNDQKEEYKRQNEARDARANDRYAKGWKSCFRFWNNPADRFSFLLVLATFFLAYVAWATDKTLRETLISANRAWLTPNTGHIDGFVPSTEKPFGYFVNYGNIGKEPALNFVAQEEIGTVDNPNGKSWYSVFDKATLKDICVITHAAESGGVVYPSGSQDYVYAREEPAFKITPEILNLSKIIFAHGCFAYKTFGAEHKSEYCLLFVPTSNPKMFGAAHCPYGNTAY
jgi:hypothetical protein